MLRSYCLEYGKDWDEGVHLLLFAVREVVQESLGFSPAEPVFAHTVRGPLKLLHEKWVGNAEPQNLLDYVCDFRSKLHRACELAKQSMAVAQGKMKYWFDKDAQSRSFSPGDKVLVLLPVPGSSLQARYSGPYVVREKVGARDYVVATPDRRRRSRLCHINMLKPYLQRGSALPSPAVLTSVALSGAEVIDQAENAVALSSADLLDASEDVDFDGDIVLSSAVVHGRLKNSELLANLDGCFSHLSPSQSEDVCEFGQATVTYLGKVVGRGQVRPVHTKVEAMLSFPVPSSRRELHRFLGMAGYYRSFCKNFSAVAAPLTDLLSPKLSVDASDAGAGAVLLQEGIDGVEHPISYFSKKFNKHQRVYSIIEKEALALTLALRHFEVYVGSANSPTVVYTDHNPLVFVNQMQNTNQRLMRWALFLQSWNIVIKHVKGRDNILADTLSRC
ncbi:Retrovirus-related Pol polyprotein from transposon 17.6 [Collichthys lucidus]|uniref:Retrovirus-related Pol polyprotein from transposon 17.6 n=1 Tax=Collichthys lucidus TaxID=240159 RepID=A0A4U5TXJ6_COLLU|nr:Retrovirus-related Pol polyprotein from transposon 17.6 [Collichthys lucidus]